MEINYSDRALIDVEYWKKSGNKQVQKKINLLLEAIKIAPYHGIGKPEALKYDLAGFWSRRITHEDRLVYSITEENSIQIHSLRGHYI
ncbi:Txe/YoeB family addiction module toxin [Flavobacterium branchiophilum]|uniref:Putative mRNA interferase YoeB n=1 Tax=Flavobacterium branchiophilum (strain FL-15) TaxID=1034807 RepID=G2Z285_FLABF|nr:Txe/YoeB family addiction module toxin [Flavobacterium branchiophilum]CCB70040.1 Addiction module toxin, Txe/YoeB family [Flavobacterium branchiophilum FL-15]